MIIQLNQAIHENAIEKLTEPIENEFNFNYAKRRDFKLIENDDLFSRSAKISRREGSRNMLMNKKILKVYGEEIYGKCCAMGWKGEGQMEKVCFPFEMSWLNEAMNCNLKNFPTCIVF